MKERNSEILDVNKKGAYKRNRIFAAVLTYAAAIFAVLCMIGIVVSVLMLNFGAQSEARNTLLYILSGSFAGGAALMGVSTYLLSKLMNAAALKELDYRERLDGEESFFVGEGTLLTFGDKGLTLHGEVKGKTEPVFVPYGDTRFISICTRRKAEEKGNWCVAIEIPVKYLTKKREESEKEDEKVLVQADAKERLYKALEKHNLTLLGEERGEGNKKFSLIRKFSLPNRKKRQRSLITLGIGVLAVGGCVPLGIFVNAPVAALVGAVGLVLLLRGILAFIRAKAVFGIYQEGIFWRESSGKESVFLKWEDIEKITPGEQSGYPVITFHCSYGRYAIPAAQGAYESIEELKKEKCSKES